MNQKFLIIFLLISLSNLVNTNEYGLGIFSMIEIEKIFETEFDEIELGNAETIVSSPRGTRLALTGNAFRRTTISDRLYIIDTEQVDAAAVIPRTAVLGNGFSGFAEDIATDRVNMAAFFNEEEIVVHLHMDDTSGDTLQNYVKILDVQNNLGVAEKENVRIREFNALDGSGRLSADRKGDLVAIGGNSIAIIDITNYRSTIYHRPDTDGDNLIRTFTFDKRPSVSKLIMAVGDDIGILDYTTSTEGSINDAGFFRDDGIARSNFYYSSLEQNSLNMTRLLAGVDKTLRNQNTNARSRTFFYYNMLNVRLSGFQLLAQSEFTRNQLRTMTLGIRNIVGTDFFLALVFREDNDYNTGFLELVDASTVASFVKNAPVLLSKTQMRQAVDSYLPSGWKNPRVTAFTRLVDGQNKFAFIISHGTQDGDTPQDKAGVVALEFKKPCHETCGSCYYPRYEKSCHTCADGYELVPFGADPHGVAVGVCQKTEEQERIDNGGLISLEFATTTLCATNQIRGCIKCSNTELEKCSSCLFQLGLDGYNDDYTAGVRCVDCPVEGCAECEMGPGDVERRCSSCMGGKELIEVDGVQKCFGRIMQLIGFSSLAIYFFKLT